ncbi:hypothetical protein HYU07_00055 [Candidatus Woesearchaeota archaeon]|nr:hypothetical protein [Candidatus Woesearchaeota archaeon]
MIDKKKLLGWLSKLDKKLDRKMAVIAVGGTAMTLLGLKSSTIDIDLCVSSRDKISFENALDKKLRADIFVDGYIFSEQLPSDYVERAKEIVAMKNIVLKALNPADIIITKAARLNARDEEDIEALSKYVKKEELVQRFGKVVGTFAGRKEDYEYHLEIILKRFYGGS